jgi:ABC-2 type transport system permease protein
MSFWRRELRATYAFVERNWNMVKRYWGWEVVWITYSIVNSLAITFIGAGMEKISGQPMNTQYLILYLLVGTLIWSYLSVVFDSISEMIAWERWEGTIEYTFMAPVARPTHMIGTTLFSVSYGILRTLIKILCWIPPSLLGGGKQRFAAGESRRYNSLVHQAAASGSTPS